MTNNEIVVRALANTGITALNEMQQAVLDAGTTKDMVLLSPTGSGKTLAFLLPLLTTLTDEDKKIQAVIIAPSRELALQIETVFRSLGAGYKVNCCYGGHPIRTEKKSLEHPPTVLIGTPGRIVDHLERGNINLDSVRTLILDEFDKSLELGFLAEMKEILAHLPGVRRRVLTSATAAVDIPAFTGITAPVRLSFLKEVKESKGLALRVVKSPVKDKLETLYKLLGELKGGSALIFCNYRETVERVSNYLTEMGVDNEYFHGGMEQPERERALSHFRNGSATVFISTDLASRGLDIPEYITREPDEFFLPEVAKKPVRSEWVTLTINRGKRDKLSKKDVVGFLFQKGGLEKDDLGIVEIKESCAFAAVKRTKLSGLLGRIRNEKIKNMKAKFI